MYQVHVRETPARPRLALVCSGGLLAIAVAACGFFVWQQRSVGLDDRWTPSGWSVSFAPPRGWDAAPLDERLVGFKGYQLRNPREPARLWVGRMWYPEPVSPVVSCRTVIRSALQHVRGISMWQAWAAAANASVEPALLGQLEGVESQINVRGAADFYYVGVVPQEGPGSESYLLAFFTADRMSTRDLRIMAAVADSFEVEGAPAEP